MRIRKIAILVDGGFFLKRIKRWPSFDRQDPKAIAEAVRLLCKSHVQKLIGEDNGSMWLDHVYRMFFYDAAPFSGTMHNPLTNQAINFSKSDAARFRQELFDEIRKKRKFALRLGSVKRDGEWVPYDRHMKKLIRIWHEIEYLKEVLVDPSKIDAAKNTTALAALSFWSELRGEDVKLPLRQKGVDMRIGLDITTMTMKKQVDTIVLVTGDSDFIPAAKIARREGVEFILDPMWQSVESDLLEHIDGLTSGFDQPNAGSAAPPPGQS